MSGKVYLIGAGPGDPGLITARGLELLRQAQVVVHDRLISVRLLSEAPKNADIIDVGKESGYHAFSQEAINALLVKKAQQGKTVVRLKGGDPFLYGRGGEEAETLVAAGIPFEVVPGVSSALAVPTYAGIPVTHRQLSAGVRIMTGHRASELDQPHSDPHETVVALMAASRLPQVVRELIEEGYSADTPAAIVERGTTAQQRTLVTTLGDVAMVAKDAKVAAPAILVVGYVVSLRERIQWAEARPLAGLRALLVGDHTSLELARRMESLGAECRWTPLSEIKAPKSWRAVDAAIAHLRSFARIVFFTPQDVAAFLLRMQHAGVDLRDLAGIHLTAIGGEATEGLIQHGLRPDTVLRASTSKSLAAGITANTTPGAGVLLAGRDTLTGPVATLLTEKGVKVSEAQAYETVQPRRLKSALADHLADFPDLVVFTSPEDVAIVLNESSKPMAASAVATIGQETTRAARKADLRVIASAPDVNRLLPKLVQLRHPSPAQSQQAVDTPSH